MVHVEEVVGVLVGLESVGSGLGGQEITLEDDYNISAVDGRLSWKIAGSLRAWPVWCVDCVDVLDASGQGVVVILESGDVER